jgi:hypothetical protein
MMMTIIKMKNNFDIVEDNKTPQQKPKPREKIVSPESNIPPQSMPNDMKLTP